MADFARKKHFHVRNGLAHPANALASQEKTQIKTLLRVSYPSSINNHRASRHLVTFDFFCFLFLSFGLKS